MSVAQIRDVALVAKTISTGEKLTFTIYSHEAEPSVRLRLELPNDQNFARLYNQLRAAV